MVAFTITEKAPTRAFFWLKAPTTSVIVQLHRLIDLRHYSRWSDKCMINVFRLDSDRNLHNLYLCNKMKTTMVPLTMLKARYCLGKSHQLSY